MTDSNLFQLACRGNSNVLITGPTGSGKTFLARRIHERGPRHHKPFVTVNLATLHEGTLESELFGHERGAFTGADQKRVGRLELAQGGTVFLDEIGELPPRLQARLLEFLQSRTVSPVGSSSSRKLDVRVIAATHRNLYDSVARGEFREDLFHRLRVVSLGLKPISERPEEFDELVHGVLEELCAGAGKSILRLSVGVAEMLERHDWPGNIRELRNVMEFAVQSCESAEITPTDMPPWFGERPEKPSDIPSALGQLQMALGMDFQAALEKFEKEFLRRALSRCRGRINLTARRTGISKTTLLRRIKAYGLQSQESEMAFQSGF